MSDPPSHSANRPDHVDFAPYAVARYTADEARRRAREFDALMASRRSCRFYSSAPVSRELILQCIETANRAPSGANRQPWRFIVVDDPALKRRIREAAEAEERESYDRRMPVAWLAALHPIGTDWRKPFLETAPFLVVIFRVDSEMAGERRVKSYYPAESVGLAAGFFLAACHNAGLATLTHTPSPMGFLRELLGRPAEEKPFLLIPVGYPAADAVAPNLAKKSVGEVTRFNRE
jgi:nitroreductase